MSENSKPLLFRIEDIEPWRVHWKDMPEFRQDDLTSWKSIIVHFATPGDLAAFAEAIGQNVGPRTRSTWFPAAEVGRYANKRYRSKTSESEVDQ